jgi:hypothetical protein
MHAENSTEMLKEWTLVGENTKEQEIKKVKKTKSKNSK